MNLSRTMSWTVFPRIYANLHWKGCFQLCCQVWRPIISTIDSYMSFFKIWEIITEIFDSWKIQNVRIFYFWKNSPQNRQFFQLFTLYSKGRHFRIRKFDILIAIKKFSFCDAHTHLSMGRRYFQNMVLRLKCSSPCHLSFDIAYVGVWMFRFYKTMSGFFISEKTAPKIDNFFNFLPCIQRAAISESESLTS